MYFFLGKSRAYCQAVARDAEVLKPGQPVHDAGQVHQKPCEDLKHGTHMWHLSSIYED